MVLTRNDVDFEEIGGLEVTYKSLFSFSRSVPNGNVMAGKAPVKLVGNRMVGPCSDGDKIHGKLLRVEPDGKAVVKVRGYATFPSSGPITFGNNVLAAGGDNIKNGVGEGAREVIDASDPSEVVVFLG